MALGRTGGHLLQRRRALRRSLTGGAAAFRALLFPGCDSSPSVASERRRFFRFVAVALKVELSVARGLEWSLHGAGSGVLSEKEGWI